MERVPARKHGGWGGREHARRPHRLAVAAFFLVFVMPAACGSPASDRPAAGSKTAGATASTASRTTTPEPGDAPVIASPPRDLVVTEGAASFFRVRAKGTPPVKYRWRKEGGSAYVSTQPDLWFVNPVRADSGAYTVEISNPWGKAVARCQLTVNPRAPRQE